MTFAVLFVLLSAAASLLLAVIRSADRRVDTLSVTVLPGSPPGEWLLTPSLGQPVSAVLSASGLPVTLEFCFPAAGRSPGGFTLAPGMTSGGVRIAEIRYFRGPRNVLRWSGEELLRAFSPVFGISNARVESGEYRFTTAGKFARLACRADLGHIAASWAGEGFYRSISRIAYGFAALIALLAGFFTYLFTSRVGKF